MKKGFTLVELLAVLTLLAFVAIISVPIMDTLLDSSKRKTLDAQTKEIISAAKKYVLKYEIEFDEDNEYLLSLDDLKKSEFLNDETYINAETKEPLDGCVYINYNDEYGKYKYAYIYDCTLKNDTSSDTCFVFDETTQTITRRKSTDICNNERLVFPTSINGVKVRHIGEPTALYLNDKVVGDNIMVNGLEYGDISHYTGMLSNGESRVRSTEFTPIKPNTRYYFERLGVVSYRVGLRFYDKEKKYIGKAITGEPGNFDTKSTYFTSMNNAYYFKIIDEAAYLTNTYYLGEIITIENVTNIDLSKAIYLESIGNNSFKKTSGVSLTIDMLDLSNNSLLKRIGDNAFEGSNYLKINSVKLPNSLEEIGDYAFKNNNIKELNITSKLKRIQQEAFYGNDIERLVIPTNVMTLGSKAFGNNKLITVTIESKENENDFVLFNNPFAENPNLSDGSIIWKNSK
ncbi:MAG: leucine-rich repeat protein [Bacilli bacterium]|nr:leucine-rich repeat protein [Bacilli bacterium]